MRGGGTAGQGDGRFVGAGGYAGGIEGDPDLSDAMGGQCDGGAAQEAERGPLSTAVAVGGEGDGAPGEGIGDGLR